MKVQGSATQKQLLPITSGAGKEGIVLARRWREKRSSKRGKKSFLKSPKRVTRNSEKRAAKTEGTIKGPKRVGDYKRLEDGTRFLHVVSKK